MLRPRPLGGEPLTLGSHAQQEESPLLPEDGTVRTNLQQADGEKGWVFWAEGTEGPGSGERGIRTGAAAAGRARLWKEDRAPCLLPSSPSPGPGGSGPRPQGGRGAQSPRLLPQLPRSLLLPPPLPSVSAGHRAPSRLPGMPRPAPSGLPPPSPCASHACLLAPERRGRAPGTGPWCPRSFCPGGSMAPPHPPPLRPLPPPQWVTSPRPHQPFCSQSPGPSDSRATLPCCPPDPRFVFSAVPAAPERRLHVIPAPSMSVE